jgi:hypothetical protein
VSFSIHMFSLPEQSCRAAAASKARYYCTTDGALGS